MKIRKVSNKKMGKIETSKKPRGLFYAIEKYGNESKVYVGVANHDGVIRKDEFLTLEECERWLTK